MKVVVVGFAHDKENSVHYEKVELNPLQIDLDFKWKPVARALWKAQTKGAEFASVRFVP
jgi:hypothetical protein